MKSVTFKRVNGYIVPLEQIDKKPDWFVIFIYGASIAIFGGVMVLLMFAFAGV